MRQNIFLAKLPDQMITFLIMKHSMSHVYWVYFANVSAILMKLA